MAATNIPNIVVTRKKTLHVDRLNDFAYYETEMKKKCLWSLTWDCRAVVEGGKSVTLASMLATTQPAQRQELLAAAQYKMNGIINRNSQ